jgi:hypothetical protein
MTTQPMTLPARPTASRPATGFPLLLIGLGILFLLTNAGLVDSRAWTRLVGLWPLALVLLGADLLLRERWSLLLLVVQIVAIAGALVYAVGGASPVVPLGTNSTTVGREGARSLALDLNYGAGRLVVHGGAADLVAVASTQKDVRIRDVQHSGTGATVVIAPVDFYFVGPDRTWDLAVPSDMPVSIAVNAGAGEFDLDLRNVQLRSLTISSGAADLTVRLAAPRGDVPVTISTGMSSVNITVDGGAAYRLQSAGGLVSVTGNTETATYSGASDRFTIHYSGGMSSVTIR